MAGKAVKRGPHYVWEGGKPTVKEMEKAPDWTVFPGAVEVKGELPYGPEYGEVGYPDEPPGEGPAWFPASGVANSSYGPAQTAAEAHGFGPENQSGDWDVEIQADDTMGGGYDDNDAAYDAVGAGWTLVKAPLHEDWDEGRPTPYFRFYVLDEEHTSHDGDRYWYESVRHHYLGSQPAAHPKAADLKVVNRHRKTLGMDPLDLSAGWTADEIAEMADNIRKHGTTHNPAQAQRFRQGMARRNPELGNQYEYMDEVQAYAVELAPRVRGQRSIRDAYNVVIEAQDEWRPLVEKWTPMFGGDPEFAAQEIGQHLMAGIQLAMEIDEIFEALKVKSRYRLRPLRGPKENPSSDRSALKRKLMR